MGGNGMCLRVQRRHD